MIHFSSKSKAIAKLQRIERGFYRSGDENLDWTEYTKDMSQIEKEMFFENLQKSLDRAIQFHLNQETEN